MKIKIWRPKFNYRAKFWDFCCKYIIEDQNVVHLRKENPFNYDFMFSEAEGYHGVDSQQSEYGSDISDKTVRERGRLTPLIF